MNVIRYKRIRGRLECDSVSLVPRAKATELYFEDKLSGTVKLGKSFKKIDGNSCIFDTGSLDDGFYYPEIHLDTSVIEPEGFEISNGVIKLIPKDDAYVRALSREIESLNRALYKIREKLKEHDEKINGKPIF